MWVFPAPVFTPPLPLIQGCPGASIEQGALALGWNFFSHAKAVVNTDNCTAITLYNSYVSTCKYRSAQQVLDLLTKKILPAFERSDVVLFDLSKQDCDRISLPVQPQATPRYFDMAPLLPKPVPCPKGQRRNAKGTCYTPKPPCPENSKLMCTPAKPTSSVVIK